MPLGMIIFLFSDFVTDLILGSQWTEASGFVGLWGLTNALTIVLSHYSSEVYRAKGKPKLSVLAQLLHIVVLWPTVLIAVRYGFETLYIARSLVRIEMIAVNLLIMGLIIKMPVGKMFTNIIPSCIAAVTMVLVILLPEPNTLWLNIAYIGISLVLYFTVVLLFKNERTILRNLPSYIRQ